jgi:hypothetical protein
MPKSRSKMPARRPGRPRIMGPSPAQAGLSTEFVLPPNSTEQALAPPLDTREPCFHCGTKVKWDTRNCPICGKLQPRPDWYLPPDSKVRIVALTAIAMRIAGMSDPDICKALNISEKSLSPYIYRAGKNGWLDIDNPKARIQYQLMHRAVSNLDEMLENDAPLATKTIRHETTMKLLEGTVFREFEEQKESAPNQTVVAIRIDMPSGPQQQMRDDTTSGTPAYIDVESK